MTNSIADIEKADVILVTGSNTTENHPVIAQSIKRAVLHGGTQLILVDPREVPLARYASLHLRPKPGTDTAWLNAMARVVLKESLQDAKFVAQRTEGVDDLAAFLERYEPEAMERITGIPAGLLTQAARLYAQANRASIFYAMGITQHQQGTDNVRAVANLAMLCGHLGKPGTGVNPLRGQNNVQGACDMGALPAFLPGYQRVDAAEARTKFSRAWGRELSAGRGLTIGEMVEAAGAGKLRALLVFGENPVVTEPDSDGTARALGALEMLVVQDLFLTETARMAHFVLPGRSWAEKDGTFTSTERRVQKLRRAVAVPGEAWADGESVCRLSALLGYPMSYEPAEVMREIAELTPSYAGIDHARLDKGGIQWPCPLAGHPGTPILHADGFARGKGAFACVEYKPPAEKTGKRYPLLLTTGRTRYAYHGGSMTARTALAAMQREGWLEMNPADAELLALADGDLVRVASRHGELTTRLRLSATSPQGVVFMSFHFPEERVNRLISPAFDPQSGIPEYKVTAVKIALAGGEARA